jgi:poly(3-hydroxybutyrate) depolymerase
MNLLSAVLSFLALSAAPAVAVRPSPGCGKTPRLVNSGSTTTPLRMTINGKQREYFVRLPPNYNNNNPYRLIFTLHALGGNAAQVISGQGGYVPYYGLANLVNDTAGAVFVVPNGLNNGWANQGGEDVTFLRSVIAAVEDDLCIDQDRRFSTGFSYGGAMSYSLACSLGSELRAVAALSGNPMISGCSGGTGSVAYYGQHGTQDFVLPISGGREMRDRFLRNNGCTPGQREAPDPPRGSNAKVKTVYQGCQKPVVWVVFDGQHTPTPRENGQADTWTPRETWEFFSQFE